MLKWWRRWYTQYYLYSFLFRLPEIWVCFVLKLIQMKVLHKTSGQTNFRTSTYVESALKNNWGSLVGREKSSDHHHAWLNWCLKLVTYRCCILFSIINVFTVLYNNFTSLFLMLSGLELFWPGFRPRLPLLPSDPPDDVVAVVAWTAEVKSSTWATTKTCFLQTLKWFSYLFCLMF